MGLVLAGGYSTRMGTDKGLMVYHGMPQRAYLFDLLKKCCAEAYVSCRVDQSVPDTLNPLRDRFGIKGPINGILSAFATQPAASWLILAVDMPHITLATLSLLIGHRDRTKLATCFYNPDTGQPEPLLTLWEEQAYPPLRTFVAEGNISPREFLRTHPVNVIEPPDDKTLMNFNYPPGS